MAFTGGNGTLDTNTTTMNANANVSVNSLVVHRSFDQIQKARANRMDPKIKAEWVRALRSGDYKQGQQHLNANNKYCCLGVLCEIAVKQHVPGLKKLGTGLGAAAYFGEHEGMEYSLPTRAFWTWARLAERDPIIQIAHVHAYQATHPSEPQYQGKNDHPERYTSLSVLNDRGFSFAAIADLIEEHL